nr:KH domain-containing protein [Koleobacter methoxysyntrophicus]
MYLLKDLVEILAKALVDHPEEVQVNQVEGEQSIILELRVSQEDMGKVIGKQGRIAKAIRTLVKAAAAKEGKRVVVEIIQ